jgi:hypothetical protein
VTEAAWSRWGGQDCVRLVGVVAGSDVQLRYRTARVVQGLPPMAGRLVRDGDDLCFVPRFAFLDGRAYTILVDGVAAAVLVRPQPVSTSTSQVLAILPTATEVPRNLLRLYVWFSASMTEGYAAKHVRLVDDAGEAMPGALLQTEHELWDADRRRLTFLLDPARIKRGLLAQRQISYPLRRGVPFRLVVDKGFPDALGVALRARAERRYEVGGEERRRVEPDDWVLTLPSSHTFESLRVDFDRPLDHGLLSRCLRVVGPEGRSVAGISKVGREGQSWRLSPSETWAPGPHQLVINPVLEDLAGNSLTRVFDRDLTSPEDGPRQGRTMLTFCPR